MTSDADEGGHPEPGGPPGGPPPPPPPPSYREGQPDTEVAPKREPMAVAALAVSLVGPLLLPVILGIVALVLANTAGKRIRESGGKLAGEGLVTAAKIIGVIDIVVGVVILAVAISNS